MAEALPLLRREQRRHMLSNGGLVLAALVGAFLITNERGVFQPVGLYDSALANAFSAATAPHPLNLVGVKRVLPLRPGAPGTGTGGDTAPGDRGLERRLMDALDTPDYPETATAVSEPPTELAYNAPEGAGGGTPGTLAQEYPGPSIFNPQVPPAVIVPPSMDVPPGAVPEPAIWATMILGFGIVGGSMRRRRHGVASAEA